jgi:hypothetical protein
MTAAGRWHWRRCPGGQNAAAGKEPGEGRIVGERVSVARFSVAPPAEPDLTPERWRLTCPCGHVWGATRVEDASPAPIAPLSGARRDCGRADRVRPRGVDRVTGSARRPSGRLTMISVRRLVLIGVAALVALPVVVLAIVFIGLWRHEFDDD